MKYNIIVIGGGPAGIISAVTARRYYPSKKILLIKSIEKGVIPCAIPYMFKTLKKPEDNIIGDALLEKNNIQIKIDEVVSIERKAKKIETKNNKSFSYDKIILATGSNPIVLPIEGNRKKGVYYVYTEMDYLKKLKKKINKARNIVIVGGGFIGVEFADELSKLKNVNISIIEVMPEILSTIFDSEFSQLAHQKLIEEGIKIFTNMKVKSFNGGKKVESVSLSDNRKIPADLVILGVGAFPNAALAEKAGLKIGERKGIMVDGGLRTSDPDIFAVGDCAEKRDFFTGKRCGAMLASTATEEARIAGSNLFKSNAIKKKKGTIPICLTVIGDLTFGSAGLAEKIAKTVGFEVIVGNAECVDKHPEAMPDANKIKVKLIFSKKSGILLGGQVAGGITSGGIVNIIGLAIQKKVSLTELETLQIGTHPKLTPAPTIYPLIVAAQDALRKGGD